MQAIRATFKKHPIVANVIIYGSLYTGAEFLQQTFLKRVMWRDKVKRWRWTQWMGIVILCLILPSPLYTSFVCAQPIKWYHPHIPPEGYCMDNNMITFDDIPEGAEPEPYDTETLGRYAIMGTCVFPHTLFHTYKYLDARFVGSSLPMALRKLAVDALILTPFNLTLFYTGMSAMEGKQDLLEEWRAKIVPTFLMASVFWVPANLINFKFLSPQFRVVFVGTCTVVWVSILCWMKRQSFEKK